MISKDLLTINQLAKICSTSRATLLRMEADGILPAVFQDQESGYRYYDVQSVFLVNMNLALHDAGLSHSEILKYYQHADSPEQTLHLLEDRLHTLEYHVANLRLQLGLSKEISVFPYTFPETDCYVRHVSNVRDSSELSNLVMETFYQAIQRGYRISRSLSPFETFDLAVPSSVKDGYEYDICVPVIPEKHSDELTHFNSIETISTMNYGDSEEITAGIRKILSYAKTNHLPFGTKCYVIGITNSFPSNSPSAKGWVTQICLPICPVS